MCSLRLLQHWTNVYPRVFTPQPWGQSIFLLVLLVLSTSRQVVLTHLSCCTKIVRLWVEKRKNSCTLPIIAHLEGETCESCERSILLNCEMPQLQQFHVTGNRFAFKPSLNARPKLITHFHRSGEWVSIVEYIHPCHCFYPPLQIIW